MGNKTAAPWNLSTARLFLAVLKKGAGSAFQNVAQKDVRHDQAARHMERPFERAAFVRVKTSDLCVIDKRDEKRSFACEDIRIGFTGIV